MIEIPDDSRINIAISQVEVDILNAIEEVEHKYTLNINDTLIKNK